MTDAKDELIRIDAQGVAHPIGVVASQRMRPHEGTYRLLPSPDHVVIMRYTGEDGRVDAGDGAVVRLAGEIVAAGTLCDIFALVAQTGWRGVLSVHQGAVVRRIYIDQGAVVGVKSSDPDERLGRVMYRYGHLSEADLARVEGMVSPQRRFGEIALELGVLTKETIYKAFSQQITEVVVGAMHIGDGTYFFLDGFEEKELASRQAVSINALLMDGVTRMDEVKYFAEKIPSVDHVPQRTTQTENVPAEYEQLYARIDGKTSVRDLGRLTGLGEFETMKKVYGLVQAKHVVIRPPQMDGGPVAIVAAANDVMAAVFRRAEGAGLSAELTQGLAQFTVGAGIFYDMLFRGAGPDSSGRLKAEAVAQNAPLVAPLVAQGDDPEQALRKLLFDYVSFALFSVGSALGKEHEAELQREVDLPLSALRPAG